jgi:Outer membrane efflux protein
MNQSVSHISICRWRVFILTVPIPSWQRGQADSFGVHFKKTIWCLRREAGELTGRGHLHALIAGLPPHAMTTATGFSFMRIWEQLGGGIARCLTVWAIAEAKRKMAAANAQIGVAKAAFFPALTLTGDADYSSFNAGNLLNWESQLFQIGPTMILPVLNGGRLKAGLKEARANYQATCAGYQQQVLIAFKDVSVSQTKTK